MDGKRAEAILQSYGVINVSYNGMPVWIESIHEDEAEVSFVGMDGRQTVPLSALAETDPAQTV